MASDETGCGRGLIDVSGSALADAAPFGLRIVVHAIARGPRSAIAVSESLIDGTVAAFHSPADNPAAVAAAMARKLPGIAAGMLETLAAADSPRPLFTTPAVTAWGSGVIISPADDRCYAGEVRIRPDAHGKVVELSGELFELDHKMPQ